jgi:hypothetical protein
MKTRLAHFAALSMLVAAAFGGTIPIDWADGTSGTLNGVGVTIMFSVGTVTLGNSDLSGPNFSAFPLSSSQERLQYFSRADWTVTFAQPVSGLLLYESGWRGTQGCTGTTCSYNFTDPFSVVSGNSSAVTVSGNSLLIGTTVFANGILEFSGPLTTLSMSHTDFPLTNDSVQLLTLALDAPDGVPEPSSLRLAELGGISLAVMGFLRRRKK